jgi:hypothetical protein
MKAIENPGEYIPNFISYTTIKIRYKVDSSTE